MEKPSYLRYKAGPVSLEAERQRALKTVYKVERANEKFDRNWLKDATDDFVDSWLNFIEYAKTNIELKKNGNYDTFGEELKLMKNHASMTEKRKDIEQLERVVNRAKEFYKLVGDTGKLRDTLDNQVGKYCLSFSYEGENQDLESVIEYENSIIEWTLAVKSDLTTLQNHVTDLREQEGNNIETYIRNYGMVIHYMSLVVEVIPKICDVFKSWVMADETYPRKLQEEIKEYQQRKDEIEEFLSRRQSMKDETRSKIQRAGYDSKRVGDHIQWSISERRQCRKKELAYQDEIDVLEEDIHEKELEQEKLLQENNRQNMTSNDRRVANMKRESLPYEIREMKKKLKEMRSKLNKMKLERYDVQKDLYRTQGVFEKSVKKVKRMKTRARREANSTTNLMHEMKILSGKINALNKIRSIKLDPLTIKRIHFEGYLPRRSEDLSDHLSEALRVAAMGVGKTWGGLYEELPFDPPRDRSTRKHDIQVIDFGLKQSGAKCKDAALRGLEKWRRLSNMASTKALVRTLRSVDMQSVADTLERQVIAK